MSDFNTGDVVKYVNKSNTFWKVGERHIIHEVSYRGRGQFKYSTNKGAWFQSSDFLLLRKADKKSFQKLDRDLAEEFK